MKFILGPPCSGKGTIISKLDNVVSFSAGNILREMCETQEYSYLREDFYNGKLVAVDLICEILFQKAEKYDYNILFDAFPKNEEQALIVKQIMIEKNIKCDGIFYIHAHKYLIIERMFHRTYCTKCHKSYSNKTICCDEETGKRKDDNLKVFLSRLDLFYEEIDKIIKILEGPVFFIENSHDINETVNKIKTYYN